MLITTIHILISAVHDPQSGFHDIKALPEFQPSNLDYYLAAALLPVLLLLIYLIKRISSKSSKASQSISTHVIAIDTLRTLQRKHASSSINLREFSSTASQTFRGYLEHVLTFPAKEQTVNEVHNSLCSVSTTLLSDEDKHEITILLKKFEKCCFANTLTENTNLNNEIDSCVQLIQKLSKTHSIENEKETKR